MRQPVVNTVKMTRCCCRQRQHSANTTHGTTSALSSALHSNTANTTRKHTAHTHHTRITQASAPGCRPPRAARRPRASARPSALRRPTAGARCRPAAACRGRGGSRPGRAAGSAGLFIGVCWRRYVSSDMEEELAASKRCVSKQGSARRRSAAVRDALRAPARHLLLPLSCVPLVLSRSTRNQVPPAAAALSSHTISACLEDIEGDLIEKVLPVLTRPIFSSVAPALLSVSPAFGPDMMVRDSCRNCCCCCCCWGAMPAASCRGARFKRARVVCRRCCCCWPSSCASSGLVQFKSGWDC